MTDLVDPSRRRKRSKDEERKITVRIFSPTGEGGEEIESDYIVSYLVTVLVMETEFFFVWIRVPPSIVMNHSFTWWFGWRFNKSEGFFLPFFLPFSSCKQINSLLWCHLPMEMVFGKLFSQLLLSLFLLSLPSFLFIILSKNFLPEQLSLFLFPLSHSIHLPSLKARKKWDFLFFSPLTSSFHLLSVSERGERRE